MDDPDVILGVDVDADAHALIPAVRHRLRERRIDFEARHLNVAAVRALRAGLLQEQRLTGAEDSEERHEDRTNQQVLFHAFLQVRLKPDTTLTHDASFYFRTNFCTRLPSRFSPVYRL